jgi:hypothetical protein
MILGLLRTTSIYHSTASSHRHTKSPGVHEIWSQDAAIVVLWSAGTVLLKHPATVISGTAIVDCVGFV